MRNKMKKETNILVPLDFSACSENALAFALQLADKIEANLLLLHVLHLDTGSMENFAFVVDEVENRTEQARENINKAVQKEAQAIFASLDKAPSTRARVEIGNVEATICDMALRNQADYIVMGTQGENSVLDKYLGSVASNVLKNAPCPIMVIPENTVLAEKIVLGYATEFSDADPFEIWKAMKLFQPFKPTIKCVHFADHPVSDEDKIKEWKQYFTETSPELNVELYSLPTKDKVRDMDDFIAEHNINTMVMYKPQRSFLESIFHRSYTQKMARHTKIPLLVLKEGG